MNSFDGFTLTGANIARYLPVYGNASGIIGAYRKYAEPHRKYEPRPLSVGQTPLFLLDGEVSSSALNRASGTLNIKNYAVIYRPFDIKLKKRYENAYARCTKIGFIKKDGSAAEWLQEDFRKYETVNDEYTAERKRLIQPYLDYMNAQKEYAAAIAVPPSDAATGREIKGDLNEYLFNRAKIMFPLGVESVLEANAKQSVILKPQYFIDGINNAPAPKGVREYGQDDGQMALFETEQPYIGDAAGELRGFFKRGIRRDGAVKLADIVAYCAEIGLYKGNVTLYAIGLALRDFNLENVVFYDGVAYWRYTEIYDISSWFLRIYDNIERRRTSHAGEAALFPDDTALKARIEGMFNIGPLWDKRLDTLGAAVMRMGRWIVENLRYPIAFLDGMLHLLYMEHGLYGEKLQRYNAYFTDERCAWIKSMIPRADTLARQKIKDTVGFDPDTACHSMSRLPKGHYAPVLYSASEYIDAIQSKPVCV